MAAKPIHEVFRKRAQRIGLVLQHRIGRFRNWHPNEPMRAFVHSGSGGTSLVQFQRVSDAGCWIEFGLVTAAGTSGTTYGPETILKAEDLGAVSAHYDNTHGFKPIELSFRDLFAKTDTKEKEASGGTSTKITIEAEEGIEGFGSVKESLEEEVHAEFAEREGSEVTNEREGEEATIIPVGKSARVTLTRQRADTELEVTSHADFTFNLKAGSHDHRWNHGWKSGGPPHKANWDSWQDFVDAVQGDAPDNICLAESFKHHRVPHRYRDVLDELAGEVRYKVRFEGKIIRDYTVQGYNADGSDYNLDQDDA